MASRRIPLSALRVGMHVVKLDRGWFWSPFLSHSFRVKTTEQIEKLRRHGIKEVEIDPARGLDITDESPSAVSSEASPTDTPPQRGSEKTLAPSVPSLQTLRQNLLSAREARTRIEQGIRSTFSAIEKTGVVPPDQAKWITIEVTAIAQTLPRPALFMAFSQDRSADPLFSQHAMSVSGLAMILGHTAGLDIPTLQDVVTGGLLHDSGLLQLPVDLRRRCQETSSHLSFRQQGLYRIHPRLGAVALERQGVFSPAICQLVADHHVLLNDTGFPKETRGAFTTEATRVVMVADRYDELLTGFGGASPLTPHQALQRLYQDGETGMYDPRYVALFVKLIGIYPVYSGVKLNTGERGIVTAINEDKLYNPVVTVTHNPDGMPYPVSLVVDLGEQDADGPLRSVTAIEERPVLETLESFAAV